MSRTALARSYRPRTFAEIATQEHVAQTLRAAVAGRRVAHAYLFAGPRGVGKTTAARVLAMALNCPNRTAAGEPCGTCESCDRIWSGKTSLDVIEIDAASNRGVDDARDLRERAMYAPTEQDRWKVYIVDEAHMLTREAWNALLKILEEPPPRVIFVFATTEPQKIQQAAPPILSRTQRFDFRRIGTRDIVARLQQVLHEEHVNADEHALLAIARKADGGMRDALSLTDQVLSFAGDRVALADVTRVLGLIADEVYLELFQILAGRQHAEVFRFVDRLINEGYDIAEFQRGLADAIRTLMIVQLDSTDAAEVPADLRSAYAAVAKEFATGDLLRMLSQVAELDTEGRLRKNSNPRVLLETLLLRFAHLASTINIEELLQGVPAKPRASPSSAPPAQADKPVTDVEGAWQELLAERAGLPQGLHIFLKVASVSEQGAGVVRLSLPPGPGRERLSTDPTARVAIEKALAQKLGRKISLQVDETGERAKKAGEPPRRLTPELVKTEKLSRMAEADPLLKTAVDEWYLELLD